MPDEPSVNAQEIMSQIQEQVRAQQGNQDGLEMPEMDPQLRAHLVRLREMGGGLQLEPTVCHSSLPVLGPLVTWWRTQIHQLVLFYINNLTRQQVAFQQAVTRTLVCIAERHETEGARLRSELDELRRKLVQLGAPDDEN